MIYFYFYLKKKKLFSLPGAILQTSFLFYIFVAIKIPVYSFPLNCLQAALKHPRGNNNNRKSKESTEEQTGERGSSQERSYFCDLDSM